MGARDAKEGAAPTRFVACSTDPNRIRVILLVIYAVAVVSSFAVSVLKYRALAFHTRDYVFYMQFASRLFDAAQGTLRYTLRPTGHNVLGFYGTESLESFHQSTHFEPVKYLYALCYASTHSALFLLLGVSLVYFLPILYLGAIHSSTTARNARFVVLFAILYVVYPASILTPGYDLRPYIFLAPLLALSMMAITHERPVGEQVLLFNSVFLAREEALILTLFVAGYAVVTAPDRHNGRRLMLLLGSSWVVWCAMTVAFCLWAGYPNSLAPFASRHRLVLLGCMAALVIAGAYACVAYWRRGGPAGGAQMFGMAIYGLVFVPFIAYFVSEEWGTVVGSGRSGLADLIQSPRYSLYFVSAIVFVMTAWRQANEKCRRHLSWMMASWVVLLLLVDLSRAGTALATIQEYAGRAAGAKDVFALRRLADRHQSWVLCDFTTHQAYYDFDHAYVFARVPPDLFVSHSRGYRADINSVRSLLRDRIEFVVVSKASAKDMRALMRSAQVTGEDLFENERFLGMRVLNESSPLAVRLTRTNDDHEA